MINYWLKVKELREARERAYRETIIQLRKMLETMTAREILKGDK